MNNVPPRFMKEYAEHIKKNAKHWKEKDNNKNGKSLWDIPIKEADSIISYYERGFITEREAMQMLSRLAY